MTQYYVVRLTIYFCFIAKMLYGPMDTIRLDRPRGEYNIATVSDLKANIFFSLVVHFLFSSDSNNSVSIFLH